MIDDPVSAVGTEEEIMREFRKIRGEIKKRIEDFVGEIRKGERP